MTLRNAFSVFLLVLGGLLLWQWGRDGVSREELVGALGLIGIGAFLYDSSHVIEAVTKIIGKWKGTDR